MRSILVVEGLKDGRTSQPARQALSPPSWLSAAVFACRVRAVAWRPRSRPSVCPRVSIFLAAGEHTKLGL
ncbi:hypothetical protein E2C01_098476 [Portunus trituberculatus]|uniref:Uncharacterized protein n=1 Tax=Portunus trituberculatus TaxID=210409 RepID=A0A5B7K733_PORTR|nr:hypothetical protein [Portunus trituberculatus]